MDNKFVTLVDSMGTDLSVVNAARVSFGKKHDKLTEGDKKLIRYLAKHGHWTPFGHATLSYHIKAPIFVARQLIKHQVGLTWNEVSRRYVDDTPDFYDPEHWRARAEDKKQGSNADEHVDWIGRAERTSGRVFKLNEFALHTYNSLLNAGVCPEQARMVLPQSMMTEWYWTGSLYAFSRVCNLRCKVDTQEETRNIAWEIHDLAKEKFPVSWPALFDDTIGKSDG